MHVRLGRSLRWAAARQGQSLPVAFTASLPSNCRTCSASSQPANVTQRRQPAAWQSSPCWQTAAHSIAAAAVNQAPPEHAEQTPAEPLKQQATGAFARMPYVQPAEEHIASALKRARRVPLNVKLKSEVQRSRNLAARQLDTLTKELAVPLGRYVRDFPSPARLHPFERALLELTLGAGAYERALTKVNALRKAVLEVGKSHAGRANKASGKKEAEAVSEAGFAAVDAAYQKGSAAIEALRDCAKRLRRLPNVEPDVPAICLVGAPNVGKSSLVQAISSGLPEVQDYPFTTRSIKVGHFKAAGRRYQVTDTPGLLNRPDEERNAMERLTLATLWHLPTSVLFVIDLTEGCGTSVPDQRSIRDTLRRAVPDKPWLDVFSKDDLLEAVFAAASGQHQHQAGLAQEESSPGRVDASTSLHSAVQLVRELPSALRVSSLTSAGLPELQQAVMQTLLRA